MELDGVDELDIVGNSRVKIGPVAEVASDPVDTLAKERGGLVMGVCVLTS